MHLINKLEAKAFRKEALEMGRNQQALLNVKASHQSQKQIASAENVIRRGQEPIDFDTRYKEYQRDERR